jgi:hypothetical protein
VVVGARFMLQKLDSEIRECYRHAAENSRRADESRDAFTRKDFLEAEKRWLCLARSYEFAEGLSNFTEPARRRKPENPKSGMCLTGLHVRRRATNDLDLIDSRPAQGSMNHAEPV